MQAPYPQPPYPQAGPPPKSGFPTWLLVVLIVVGLGVVVVGIMAVLAIFGVRKYVSNTKTAEARNYVGQIAKYAQSSYEFERVSPTLGEGTSATIVPSLCESASRSVPASIVEVQGKKYQSSLKDWKGDGPDAGFECLKFTIDSPQYFMYSYTSTGSEFTARANGDLNGDGVMSTFEVKGKVSGGKVEIAPLSETSPEE